MATNRKAPPDQLIESIRTSMAGVPWDANLVNRIADLLHRGGYSIPEVTAPPGIAACCPMCHRTDELSIRETYIALHPYDAQTHEATALDGDDLDEEEGEGDYMAYCSSCGHKGELALFGIPDDFTWEDQS